MAFPPSPLPAEFFTTNPGSFEFERTIDAIDFRKDPRAVLPGEILSSAVGGRLPSDDEILVGEDLRFANFISIKFAGPSH